MLSRLIAASRIAAATVVEKLSGDTHFSKVVFCCFTSATAELHEQALRALKLKVTTGADEILVMRVNTHAEPNGCRNPADKPPVCNVKVQTGRQLITAAHAPALLSDERA